MTELDPEEEAVLESARRALSPPDAVTQRMRAALLVKIAAPGIVVGASAAASSAAAASGGVAAAASAAAATTGSAAPLAAATGGAIAGAKLAVGAGLLKAAAGITTAVLLATATSPYWLPEPTPTASAPAGAAALATTAPTGAPRVRPAPVDGPILESQEAPSAQVPAKDVNASPAPTGPVRRAPALTNTPEHRDTPEQQLQGELDLLKRAQQAIQAGQAQRALDLLAKLDAEHPASSLGQEREVARVLALCGVGRVASARQVAERVLGASPNSLYAGRIQASCAALPSKPSAQAPVVRPKKSTAPAPPVARFGDSGN